MFRPVASLFAAAILCGSCNRPTPEPSQSLVGATEIPSADDLSRETIYITRGANDWGGDRLSYELRPNDSLSVTHTYSDPRSAAEGVKGKETLRMSPGVAAQFRKLMWRVRPGKLEGQGLDKDEVRPVGCERQGPHDFGEVGVAFFDEGDARASEDDRVGLFELPSANSCNRPAATEAREAVWDALRLLPKSKVAAGFDRTQ